MEGQSYSLFHGLPAFLFIPNIIPLLHPVISQEDLTLSGAVERQLDLKLGQVSDSDSEGSIVASLIYNPTNSVQGFSFIHILTSSLLVVHFFFTYFNVPY